MATATATPCVPRIVTLPGRSAPRSMSTERGLVALPMRSRALLAELRLRGRCVGGPDDLRRELAVGTLLPLHVDHVVRDLLAVRLGVERELHATVEEHDVDLVERRLHLGGVD